ncbi:uncharacterized protein LOC118229838 [Anguilla anguilla]|uniref:uncharacterized protein LOC118229838 n=1 Tax=Anguilla anguilla TaxID=7936 RepID=UPI0015A79B72|nr:uncharacterized protein LOC118229838 [Anguilla anguilla]
MFQLIGNDLHNTETDSPTTNETICTQATENQKRTKLAATTSNVQIQNYAPKSHNLVEGNNTSDTVAITLPDVCNRCQKPFQTLLVHLCRSKQCQLHYNFQSLHQEVIVKHADQKHVWQGPKRQKMEKHNQTEVNVGLNHVEQQPLPCQKAKEATPIEASAIKMNVTRKRQLQGNPVEVTGRNVAPCNVNKNTQRDCPRTNETICKQAKENHQIQNIRPKFHNLHEANNTSDTITMTSLDVCKGCQKPFQRLMLHLSRSIQCQLHYNMSESNPTMPNPSADEVVFVNQMESPCLTFSPFTMQQKKSLCSKINIIHNSPEYVHTQEPVPRNVPMSDPCETKAIVGDGNCFFRALSFSISATEGHHRKIRLAVVKHMETNALQYAPILRHGYFSVENYVKASRMKYVQTWATEVEIQAAADFFGVDVFTYSHNKWFKYSTTNEKTIDTAIYLKHCNASHYEVVTCIKQHNSDLCTKLCKKSNDCPQSHQISSSSSRRELDRKNKQYEVNKQFRDAKNKSGIKRYNEDKNYKKTIKERSINKYATDAQNQTNVKQYSAQKYAIDEQHCANKKKCSIDKYATHDQHRASTKQYSIHKYA